jgi:hypothetical protein
MTICGALMEAARSRQTQSGAGRRPNGRKTTVIHRILRRRATFTIYRFQFKWLPLPQLLQREFLAVGETWSQHPVVGSAREDSHALPTRIRLDDVDCAVDALRKEAAATGAALAACVDDGEDFTSGHPTA